MHLKLVGFSQECHDQRTQKEKEKKEAWGRNQLKFIFRSQIISAILKMRKIIFLNVMVINLILHILRDAYHGYWYFSRFFFNV